MFSIIRLIIGCIFFIASVLVIQAKPIRKKIQYVVFALVSVVLMVMLAFFPFENYFVTFHSPTESYEYYNWGKSNIVLVVEGNNCDFIVNREKEQDTYLIIPKTTDGWKIGIGLNTKRIVQKNSNGIIVNIYQYKNTNDYYITVFNTEGGELNVSDSYNTQFYSLEKNNNSLGKKFITYYAHIFDFNPQYNIHVDGNKIMLGD